MPRIILSQLEKTFNCPTIEAYGLTETVNQVSSSQLPPEVRRSGTVGQPDPNTVQVIDRDGRQVEPGEVGEIAVRGPHVHAGYLNNPQANESAFRNGWFRTGDNGVISRDGFLTVTGRMNDIINRGGEKISPHEIESLLLEHPTVLEAVVFRNSK